MRRWRAWGRSLAQCLQRASCAAPRCSKRVHRRAGAATLLRAPRVTISAAGGPNAGLAYNGLAVQHFMGAARAARAAAGRPLVVALVFLENARGCAPFLAFFWTASSSLKRNTTVVVIIYSLRARCDSFAGWRVAKRAAHPLAHLRFPAVSRGAAAK